MAVLVQTRRHGRGRGGGVGGKGARSARGRGGGVRGEDGCSCTAMYANHMQVMNILYINYSFTARQWLTCISGTP